MFYALNPKSEYIEWFLASGAKTTFPVLRHDILPVSAAAANKVMDRGKFSRHISRDLDLQGRSLRCSWLQLSSVRVGRMNQMMLIFYL